MPLLDSFGRVHDDLRISVTDRCNLRCTYCMPEEPEWYAREQLLTYEELLRVARVAVGEGVRKVRLTGGEPLVRRDLTDFVRMLAAEPGIEDLSLTTNGVLLPKLARPLAQAGLRRVNVSLDTLQRGRYLALTRRDALDRALEGLRAARDAGLGPIKVNAVLLRGRNDDEAEDLVARARAEGWQIRFIEFMPLENGRVWRLDGVVPGAELRRRIAARWPLEPVAGDDPAAPATVWRFADGAGSVGFIDSVSAPFCASCSRLRLTSDGAFRVCLYDDREADLKALLRGGADDAAIAAAMRAALAGKGRGGALDLLERGAALPLTRTMHRIGG